MRWHTAFWASVQSYSQRAAGIISFPAHGEPRALVHRVEPHSLDGLPGETAQYSRWAEQVDALSWLLHGTRTVAMQFSPLCAVPYVSMVDGGTIDLIRSIGVEVVSSANLVQLFEARWSEQQLESHLEAGRRMDALREQAFDLVHTKLSRDSSVTEWDIHRFLRKRFSEEGSSLITVRS